MAKLEQGTRFKVWLGGTIAPLVLVVYALYTALTGEASMPQGKGGGVRTDDPLIVWGVVVSCLAMAHTLLFAALGLLERITEARANKLATAGVFGICAGLGLAVLGVLLR